MTDPFENEELDEEWVEISDAQGRKAALRHIATIRCGEKNYHVLGAIREGDECEGGLLLVREDETVDGMQEYVVTNDESEIERVVSGFVSHVLAAHLPEILEQEPEVDAGTCGMRHKPWEFCYCDQPEYLQ